MSKAYNFEQLRPLIKESVDMGASFPLKVTGDSMYPILKDRVHTVYIEKFDRHILKCGDIVFVCARTLPTMHRVKKITSDGFYMVGDNQITADYVSFYDDIIGCVKYYSKDGEKKHRANTVFIRALVFLHHTRLRIGKAIKGKKKK